MSSSRITPDPSDSQQSSLQFTLTHVLQGSGQRTGMDIAESLVLCSVTHFCDVFEVCVWIIVCLEDPNMAHYKISNRVSHLLIFYLFVFDRIHDAMSLNKMSRTSSWNIGTQNTAAVYTWGTLYPCVHQTHLECLPLKSSFFVSSDHRTQSHLKFQSCLITEYAEDCFGMR